MAAAKSINCWRLKKQTCGVIQGGEVEPDIHGGSFLRAGKGQQGYCREGLSLRAFFKYSDYYPHTLENNPAWVQIELKEQGMPSLPRKGIKEKYALLPYTIKLLKHKDPQRMKSSPEGWCSGKEKQRKRLQSSGHTSGWTIWEGEPTPSRLLSHVYSASLFKSESMSVPWRQLWGSLSP